MTWFSHSVSCRKFNQAAYFAICGSVIQVVQSCVLGGSFGVAAFVSSDSTYRSDGSYMDFGSVDSTKCASPDGSGLDVSGVVYMENSVESSCFIGTGTGTCEGTCVQGFTEAVECLVDSPGVSLAIASESPPENVADNPSCPASPPTPAPLTLSPTTSGAATTEVGNTGAYPIWYRSEGLPCRAHFQCASGFCNEFRVCQARTSVGNECLEHEACQTGRCSDGICEQQLQVNDICKVKEDCDEGWCDSSGVCSPWKDPEEPCLDDFECKSGRCTRNPRRCTFVIYEPSICAKDSDCFGGRCKKDGGLNQCYARKWNYNYCDDNSDCLSLRCESTNCTEPVQLGEPCDEPSDCYSLFCNSALNSCVATRAEIGEDDVIEEDEPGITGSLVQEQAAFGEDPDAEGEGNQQGSFSVKIAYQTDLSALPHRRKFAQPIGASK